MTQICIHLEDLFVHNPSNQQFVLNFLIDLNGHRQEANINKIIEEITPSTSLLRILGSYPATGKKL